MYKINGTVYFVGKNASDNWRILDESNPQDIWIHLHNSPSCYVIIQHKKKRAISNADIETACKLCIQQSKIDESCESQEFSYLRCKYVSKGNTVGQARLHKSPDIYTVRV
jgi:predicted ribosome quality control (RQC) complex YloA/Tae2 family protein|uniref:NFACT RNA-binding domain-containing protein n=1 Tax=viral metagenome TaxID=1070528 RepID=A0A6C0JB82_9ZZZZ